MTPREFLINPFLRNFRNQVLLQEIFLIAIGLNSHKTHCSTKSNP